MKDLSGKDINSFDVYIDGTVGISSMTVTVDKAANDGLGYRFHAVAEGGGIADAGRILRAVCARRDREC